MNTNNIEVAAALDPAAHAPKIECLGKVLDMIRTARYYSDYALKLYREHDVNETTNALTREIREHQLRVSKDWAYIVQRLERYYFKKICELNAMTYEELAVRKL
jgi:hypothetical protein